MFNPALQLLLCKRAGATAPAAQQKPITNQDMQKYKNLTGASNINSARARWATRQVMNGNHDISDRAYRRAFASGKVK